MKIIFKFINLLLKKLSLLNIKLNSFILFKQSYNFMPKIEKLIIVLSFVKDKFIWKSFKFIVNILFISSSNLRSKTEIEELLFSMSYKFKSQFFIKKSNPKWITSFLFSLMLEFEFSEIKESFILLLLLMSLLSLKYSSSLFFISLILSFKHLIQFLYLFSLKNLICNIPKLL